MTTEPESTGANRKKTFVLGVGCQKGGTSWLHSYLADLPESDFGLIKEYHVLDVHYSPNIYRFEKRQVSQLRKKLKKDTYKSLEHGKKRKVSLIDNLYRVAFYNNINSYFDYFAMLEGRSEQVRLVGDITPSYALLPRRAYTRVQEQMTARGFDVKVIFLMRDPIERAHSAARMRIRDAADSGKPLDMSEEEVFSDMLSQQDSSERSHYEKTIKKMEAAFSPDQIHYGFFEELFSETEVRKVTDFLGVDYVAPDLVTRKNTTERTQDLSEAVLREAREKLAPTYDFVAEHFPERDFKTLWEHA